VGGFAVSNMDPGTGHKLIVALIGLAIVVGSIYLWSLEGNEGYHLHPEDEEPSGSGHKTH